MQHTRSGNGIPPDVVPKRFGTFTSHDFQDTYIFEMLKTGLMTRIGLYKAVVFSPLGVVIRLRP